MHLKALLTVGAATASLLAGTAGTALLGHAAAAPKHKVTQPAPHHLSTSNHTSGTKGHTGTVTHKHNTTTGKPKPKPKHHKPTPKPAPVASPSPSPHV